MILRAAISLDGKLNGESLPQRIHGAEVDSLSPEQCRVLLISGKVDEIHLIVRPHINGHRDASTLSGPPTPEFFPRSLACRLLRMETQDGECVLHYRMLRRTRSAARSG